MVEELIEILGKNVLRNLLKKIADISGPAWFSVITDEATDIVHAAQLNLSVTTTKLMKILLDCAGCQIQRQKHCLTEQLTSLGFHLNDFIFFPQIYKLAIVVLV